MALRRCRDRRSSVASRRPTRVVSARPARLELARAVSSAEREFQRDRRDETALSPALRCWPRACGLLSAARADRGWRCVVAAAARSACSMRPTTGACTRPARRPSAQQRAAGLGTSSPSERHQRPENSTMPGCAPARADTSRPRTQRHIGFCVLAGAASLLASASPRALQHTHPHRTPAAPRRPRQRATPALFLHRQVPANGRECHQPIAGGPGCDEARNRTNDNCAAFGRPARPDGRAGPRRPWLPPHTGHAQRSRSVTPAAC